MSSGLRTGASNYIWRAALSLVLGLTTITHADDKTAPAISRDPKNQPPNQGEPRVRDVWYAYEADGQRFGFEHIIVERRDDGNFAYRVDNRLLVDFLGQRQEITQTGTFIVTPALEPVSLKQEAKRASGATRTTGRVEGSDFILVYERAGLRRKARIKLADEPMFLPCLDD